MARKPDHAATPSGRLPLVALALLAAFLAYTTVSLYLRRAPSPPLSPRGEDTGDCCRGVPGVELWGAAVKWGSDFKTNSSEECCRACKEMCRGVDGPCLCDSWVFCGDRDRCKEKFGECWLKKQKDALIPALQNKGENVIWTSGVIFGKGEGIVGFETEYGTLHIKLFPECAPQSVAYIVGLLGSRHCAGCQFYRAESRGDSWDSEGNHISGTSFGPPYGLIQGTLQAEGVPFNDIQKEVCPVMRRGSVAWIGLGPEFVISLANHEEWERTYTVFGAVLPEDMPIAEKIASLPTNSDIWNSIKVAILNNTVALKVKRASKNHGDLNLNSDSGI